MTLTATVGREAELDSIQAFIDAVPRGTERVDDLRAGGHRQDDPVGSGRRARRATQGFRVLVCRGVETEASLSFAALSDFS